MLYRFIYRPSIRRFIIVSVTFILSISFFSPYISQDNNDNIMDSNLYLDKVTFWSNDYHVSPIRDLKYLLTPFGVRFIDNSLSGACLSTKTCARNLQVLTPTNGLNPTKEIRQKFYNYYKNDLLMSDVNVFVCFHPAAMCELFMPFNRTIIIIASTRYELGRFSIDEWNAWNKNLRTIAADSRNVIAANNLYDAEYIRYFTGINVTVIPSFCDYTNVSYHLLSQRPEYIFIPSRKQVKFNEQFLNELNRSIQKSNSTIRVKSLRSLYEVYNYSDLARHPAIIYLPYQLSIMSIFEQYAMNIPLFFPSLDLLTEWHLKYSIVYDRTWDKALNGISRSRSLIPAYDKNSMVPDPNNEYDYESVRYWLKFADFYQWPYITYFNSIDDLTLKLIHTNLTFISEQMSKHNNKKRLLLLKQWKTILNRIATP